jgi:serine/threonine-protein kinase
MAERMAPDDGARDGVWDRWGETDRLFDAALDVPRERRDAFVREACGEDRALLEAVLDLLRHADTTDGLDRNPAALVEAALSGDAAAPASLASGERVGRYRIIGEIGRGGMATVYEAERADGEFDRRVALKVLRRGIDTDDVVRRFLVERQILSSLTHPNIARLLDGGSTADGRPFLAMDLVDGEPITAYVERHALSVPARLRLFLEVADAVHYAHQRLVVHRDLKPSNILVTRDGRAVLLDFGIAKLLDAGADDGGLTRTGLHPLTPEYASPEQLRGEAVTTASDVYQLGLLLHVLLTGERPRDRTSTAGHDGTGTGDFVRPSTRPGAGILRGDLDTIVLKVLRLEPESRYDSAHALAADVRRHLDGLPIAARPASIAYRTKKFVGRNPLFAPAAAIALIAITAFGVTRVRHGRQLERERNQARAEAARAEQIEGFLINLFGSADPFAPADAERGRAITVVEALDLGVTRARTELNDQPLLRADLLAAIARVYESLDQREPARELLGEAIGIRIANGETRSAGHADDLGHHATLLGITGMADSARIEYEARLDLERELFGEHSPRYADALATYANFLFNRNELDRSLALRSEAVSILRAAGPGSRTALGKVLAFQADLLRQLQRPAEAEATAREALDIQVELLGDDDPTTAIERIHLAQAVAARGRLDEAARLYDEALPVLERTLGPDHSVTTASWNNYGTVLMDARDYEGAERLHRRILKFREERAVSGVDIAASLQNLAAALVRLGRLDEAESLATRAHAIYVERLPANHYLRAIPLLTLGEVRLLRGDARGAERADRDALETLRTALPASHYVIAAAECRLGAALAAGGSRAEAERTMTAAFDRLRANEQAQDRVLRECGDAIVSFYEADGRAALADRYREGASKP